MDSEKQFQENKKRSIKRGWEFSTIDIISMLIFILCFIGQFLVLFFYEGQLDINFLEYIAYGVFGLGGFLGIMPVIIFKRKGGVLKGESYINTQEIVTTGLYAIIRHPQYLSFILLSLGITLLNQSWISLILTIAIIVLTYQWTYSEDKNLIKKFGKKYEQYKEKVPRLNLIYGIIKYFIRKYKSSKSEV